MPIDCSVQLLSALTLTPGVAFHGASAATFDSLDDILNCEEAIGVSIALLGAGFVTSSSFLSWLIHVLVTYSGKQGRLWRSPARNTLRDSIIPGGYRIRAGFSLTPIMPHLHTNPAYWADPSIPCGAACRDQRR